MEQQDWDMFAYFQPLSYETADRRWQDRSENMDRVGTQARFKTYLTRHADFILERWRSMSASDRAKCLREVWANCFPGGMHMAENRWPDIELFYGEGDWMTKRSSRWIWLNPQLNVKALSEDPRVFLTYLYSRERYAPDELLLVEKREMSTGLRSGFLEMNYCSEYVKSVPGEAGTLVEFSETVHRLGLMGYPTMELILEAQGNIYSLLSSTCDWLVKITAQELYSAARNYARRNPDALDGGERVVLRKPSGRSVWDQTCADSFASLRPNEATSRLAMLPYSGPSNVNLQDIADLSLENWSNAEAEMMSLHTTPEALLELLQTLKKTGFLRRTGSPTVQWKWLALEVWAPILRRAYAWEAINRRAMLAIEVSHLNHTRADDMKNRD